jgi:PhnB protein
MLMGLRTASPSTSGRSARWSCSGWAHPNGKILHAEIWIAGSVVMIGDPDDKLYREPRALGRCTASLHIFLEDNAALLRRASRRVRKKSNHPVNHR